MSDLLPLALAAVALLVSGGARAADLLEVTDGVLGRGEVVGDTPVEVRARALVDRGEWERAAAAWSDAGQEGVDPELVRAWRIVSLARSQQWQLARLEALAALAADAGDDQHRLLFAWLMCAGGADRTAYKVAAGLPQQGEVGRAAAVLELRSWRNRERKGRVRRARRRILAEGQADAWFWLESSRGHFQALEPEALDDMERALRAPGTSGAHVTAMLQLRLALGDDAEVVRTGLAGMDRFEDSGDIASLAAQAAARPAGAATLDKVLQVEPERGAARELRAMVRMDTDDAAGALDDLLAAGRAGRESPRLVAMLGASLAQLGKRREALAALSGGAKLHPRDVELARQRFAMAQELDEPQAVLDAAVAWQDAADAAADTVPQPAALAAAQAALGLRDPGAALTWVDRALSFGRDQPETQDLRSRALQLQSKLRAGAAPCDGGDGSPP